MAPVGLNGPLAPNKKHIITAGVASEKGMLWRHLCNATKKIPRYNLPPVRLAVNSNHQFLDQ